MFATTKVTVLEPSVPSWGKCSMAIHAGAPAWG